MCEITVFRGKEISTRSICMLLTRLYTSGAGLCKSEGMRLSEFVKRNKVENKWHLGCVQEILSYLSDPHTTGKGLDTAHLMMTDNCEGVRGMQEENMTKAQVNCSRGA